MGELVVTSSDQPTQPQQLRILDRAMVTTPLLKEFAEKAGIPIIFTPMGNGDVEITPEFREEFLTQGYRPREFNSVLEKFNEGGDWKYRARLERQNTHLFLLETALKTLSPAALDNLLWDKPMAGPALAKELERMRDQSLPVRQLYDKVDELGLHLKSIFSSYALKAFTDRQSAEQESTPGLFTSRHAPLLNKLILGTHWAERLPESQMSVAIEEIAQASQGAVAPASQRALYRALAEQKKKKLIETLRTHTLDTLVRTETLVPEPSKNHVFNLSIATGTQPLELVVKVYDCRKDNAKFEAFQRELMALRYFARVDAIDPLHFTFAQESGLAAIALNKLNGKTMLTALRETATEEERYKLGEQLAVFGAKLHAYAPTNLARKNSFKNPIERAQSYDSRIIGPDAMFWPNIIALLQSQGITLKNEERARTAVANGMTRPHSRLAHADEFEAVYVDMHAANFFVNDIGVVTTKIDYGTLKLDPVQIDLVTPFIVGDSFPTCRPQLYDRHFDAYNKHAESFNAYAQSVKADPRKELRRQLRKDIDEQNEYAPLAEAYLKLLNRSPAHTALEQIWWQFLERDHGTLAMQYCTELQSFFGSVRESKPYFENRKKFQDTATLAELHRGLIMSGFYAGHAVRQGLDLTSCLYIRQCLSNAIDAIEPAKEIIHNWTPRAIALKNGLIEVYDATAKLMPRNK